LKWWQGGIFKWGILAAGIAVGACWPETFGSYLPELVILAVVSLTYVSFVWWKQ